jgi:transposase
MQNDSQQIKTKTKKKTLYADGQNREDVRLKREQWIHNQSKWDSSRLVFLDESGVNIGMTKRYGRAYVGERVVDYAPDARFNRISILSSIRLDGTIVPLAFSGALNGLLFQKYIETFLVQTLKPGDLVVMDNLSSHKIPGIAEAIERAGATAVYLPPYSPDLNPIELMWSKVKTYLRKVKARTFQSLLDTIGDALDLVSSSDISGWFSATGYSAR